MILSDRSILTKLSKLVDPAVEEHVNAASLDIRIGSKAIVEIQTKVDWVDTAHGWREHNLEEAPYLVAPGEFLLVSTYERIMVPNGLAVDLRLKSTRARQGWDHSLAFWFDPGWNGYGTMEIRNVTRYHHLKLEYGMLFAQMIFHMLDNIARRPYSGRYQGATTVEQAKT